MDITVGKATIVYNYKRKKWVGHSYRDSNGYWKAQEFSSRSHAINYARKINRMLGDDVDPYSTLLGKIT